MQNTDIGIESEPDNSAKMLNSEIAQIFQKAKEEAINTVAAIFENAKLKAEASIQTIVSHSWLDNDAKGRHFEISSEVNNKSPDDKRTYLSIPEFEYITPTDDTASEQSDTELETTRFDNPAKVGHTEFLSGVNNVSPNDKRTYLPLPNFEYITTDDTEMSSGVNNMLPNDMPLIRCLSSDETVSEQSDAELKMAGFDDPAKVGHTEISSRVNNLSLNDMSLFRYITTEETANEQYDIELDSIEAVIRDNLERLESYISDCIKTTDLIVFFDLFSSMQTKELRNIYKRNPVEATSKALNMIHKMNCQPQKYQKLLEALTNAGYPKVVQILNGTLIPIGSNHKEIIRVCTKHIFQRLNTSEILPYLFSKGVISKDDKQLVLQTERAESTGIAAIELLHMLPNRNKQWFKHFIQSLKESDHHDLANIIEDKAKIPRNPNIEDPGLANTTTRRRETSRNSLSGMQRQTCLIPSDFQTTSENKDTCVKPTSTFNKIDGFLDEQRRPTSPISISSDDYSCVLATRLDHVSDFSDSSPQLDNE